MNDKKSHYEKQFALMLLELKKHFDKIGNKRVKGQAPGLVLVDLRTRKGVAPSLRG